MKILKSFLFDFLNRFLFIIQSKLDGIRSNSVILSNINLLIFFVIVLVYSVSLFAQNNITALFALLVPILVMIKVFITKGEKLELETCNFYLIVYLMICFISNFTSYMPFQSFYGFSKTLLYFAFYFAMCQFLKNNKQFIIPIIFAVALLIAGESITGLLQNTQGVENIATWQDTSYVNSEDILTRVYGTLKPYNPNLFGGWLIAGFPSLIGISAIFFCKKQIIRGIFALIFLLSSILCIFYTGCRGAYIALFSIIMCSLIVLFQMNKLYKIISAIIITAGILFLAFSHGIMKRLMSIFIMRGDSSTSFRMNVYNSAIQMFQDNPVCGIGVGNKVFREIYGLYMLSGFDALSCYSVFLEMAVESGIFSLLAFLIFLFSILKASILKFYSTQDKIKKIIFFTACTSIIAVMMHGLVDTIYFRPQIQFIFWTMAAILTVLTREDYFYNFSLQTKK